ncbi:MAG: CE1759 family FMN reductase [Mycobacteriaceae bacterium]|uniref:CE1759 family FMN reductase n=1 Tax=Corynebacterium sp. TaxID=1720 RepID=UPI003F98F931
MKKLVIINAGLSDPSTTLDVAQRVSDATLREVAAAGEGLEIETVNLRGLATDLASFMTTFIPSTALEEARRTVGEADALIAATPVFQGSYSGLFKMFFDALDMHALDGIPVSLVATAGTPRHSMVLDYAMRPLLSFLHAVVLPTGVFVATQEFGSSSELPARISRAAGELAIQLTTTGRVEGFTADSDGSGAPDSDFTVPDGGFASLLKGHSGS